jgi:hypothetical protein
LLQRSFQLAGDGDLAVYYGPFDGCSRRAQMAIVGLTPGWTQMQIAYQTAAQALRDGLGPVGVYARVKKQAAFAGSMRTNLIAMLDGIGVPEALGFHSASELFDAAGRMHATSSIRYPVFVNGANYTGHSPKLEGSPLLHRFIDELLGPELRNVRKALIVPLGAAAAWAVERVVTAGFVSGDRCLFGFPHPSGANGHRAKQFHLRCPALRRVVRGWSGAT